MSDDLLQRLGGALRAERDGAAPPEAPPSPEAREALVAAALKELGVAAAPEPAPLRRRPRRPWFAAASAGAVALAAAASFVLVAGRNTDGPSLPAYTLSLTGTASTFRGAEDAPTGRVPRSGVVEIVARPAQAAPGPVEARVLLVQGARVQVASPPPEVSPQGAVRWRAPVADAFSPPEGRWRVVVVVAPEGRLPPVERALTPESVSPGGPARVLTTEVELGP